MTDIVLPKLSAWAQSHITALFEAKTTKDFDAAFDAFVAHKVEHIVVNGEQLSRAEYKAHLQSARAFEQSAQVKYLGTVEVASEKEGEKAGDVGLFLQASIAEKLLVFGAPETETVTISFNLKIIQDPSIKKPSGPIHGYFDPRRVSALTSVFTKTQNPIINPGGPEIPPRD
ncbi:hypothetical protein BC835DRAFT_1422771 [Cytidiella melzeri]|nr:hypothetical protein BC835DRAFT_1422771 [Cytidiella melzeri]